MSEGDTTFEYTKPRAPVAASYKGPGPCYALPGLVGRQQHDPRSRHARAPAYHFGIRPAQYADERGIGPGPCYLPPTTMYRDGKYSSPKCVMVNGRRERQQDITPGPSDYAPCRSDIMSRHRRQPAYVMSRADSAKRRQAQMTVTPGPNAYNPDAMMGPTVQSSKPRAPRYTISSRSSHGGYLADNSQPTPGPGYYGMPNTDVFKKKSPGCTIIGRYDTSSKDITPGPGAHSNDNMYVTKTKAPGYTFGIRHSEYAVQMLHKDSAVDE